MSSPGEFKLSAQLAGHDQDVKAVAFPSPELVLSASRDGTVRSWKKLPSSSSPATPDFEPTINCQVSDFVNSISFLPPTPEYPDGLVISGGKDTIIDVRPPTAKPDDNAERMLIGHAHNVCALAVAPSAKYVVSGSWDKTARIWSVGKWECEAVLTEHEAAVWDVLPWDNATVLTASADKNIRIYDLKSAVAAECAPRSTIYTPDIVRALARVPSGHPTGAELASAHNDGIIRLWKLTGEPVAELHGHESFIYNLTVLPTGELVSSGEDRSVRIWRGVDCVQTITHPGISVWSVAVCEQNGDIATGTSEGVTRVFTRTPERLATAESLAHFEDSVKSSSIPQQQMGSINKEKLPGPEFLTTKSGTKEGQVQMIKEDNGAITAHQWSMAQQQWVNVGTVVDAVGSSGKKVEYNGKEWDYVFDVAIEEGQPSLKLPYNLSENPYDRATKFIGDNELSMNYLDQVAQFIVANTQGATLGQNSEPAAPDPYGTNSAPAKTKALPQREYLDITAAKYEPVVKKILSVNTGLVAAGRKEISLNPTAQQTLTVLRETLEAGKPVPNEDSVALLVMMCTSWDYGDRLAPMDLLRCSATSPHTARYNSPTHGSIVQVIVTAALEGIPAGAPGPNENLCMMAARAIANLFKTPDGRKLFATQPTETSRAISFLERIVLGQPPIGEFNRNLLIAVTTAAVNISVLGSRQLGSVNVASQTTLLNILGRILQKTTDGEVAFRALVATGTLIMGVVGAGAPEARSLRGPIVAARDRLGAADARVSEIAGECVGVLG